MINLTNPHHNHTDPKMLKLLCIALAASLLVAGFIFDSPSNILKGLIEYIKCPDILLTDYFVIGSIGAALVNAGLVMIVSIVLTFIIKTPYNGSTVSAMFLMAGFSLFGKNPINILPFFLGVWIYSKVKKQPMARYTNVALFSTALAPVVSNMLIHYSNNLFFGIIIATASGAAIAYITIPLSERGFATHMGYSHFNVGFACGLLALVIASISQGMGHPIGTVMIWNKGIPPSILWYLILLISFMIAAGGYLSGFHPPSYFRIMRHSGRAPTDFVITDGIGVTMINMGIMGFLSLLYVLLIGGDLNGPVVGAILTVMGFGASGEHPKNTAPIVLGVWLASMVMTPSNTDPGMLLAALFGMSLAPIAGQFGPIYGIIAGFIHAAVVLVVGAPCGGFNLYNNGFSAGLVALVMLSLIQGVSKHWRHTDG